LKRGAPNLEVQSELERRALRLFASPGIPAPICQYRILDGNDYLGVVDFAWPAAKLIVEVEGFQFHSGRAQWDRDLARYNALVLRGWRIIRMTIKDFEAGGRAFTRSLRAALAHNPRAT
jgi:hypothetical protein